MRRSLFAALMGVMLAGGHFTPAALSAEPAATPAIDPVYAEIAAQVVRGDQNDAKVDGVIAATLKALTEADSDVAGLDKEFPGLITAIGDAMRPVMLRAAEQAMPGYRSDLAAMYARHLTTSEAREFADFLAEPGSRAFFGAAVRQVNYQAIANDLVAERDISATSISRDVGNAATRAVAEATPEQLKRVRSFFAAPLGQKLIGLRGEKSAIDLKWANMDMPEIEQSMEQIVIDSMIAHVGKTDPELAKQMREIIEKEQAEKKTGA